MTHGEFIAPKSYFEAGLYRQNAIDFAERHPENKYLRVLLGEYAELTAFLYDEPPACGLAAIKATRAIAARRKDPVKYMEKARVSAMAAARTARDTQIVRGWENPFFVAMVVIYREITNLETLPKIRAFRAAQKNGGKK